ncbi:MAG TPA: peptidylprolyl isomerase, partial [Candidatus Saccharimonadales bacterium]|nr:peptidylprolyl isomerase [Candidatus Saccharimonadales bacterium]
MKKLKFKKKPNKEKKLDHRITNDNLSEHREEVISSARKYKYPLRQSKHRLVVISLTIFFLAVISFFTYSILTLYKFKSESPFTYQITKIIPFPLARIGQDFVSYESYLFEINWYKHYYETQQNIDFDSESGKVQLEDYRKRASQKVINDGYVKKLAEEKGISISAEEVNKEVEIYKSQNRLGANDDQLRTVLSDYYGWSIDDFKSTLKLKLLTQKVVAALDTETKQKAEDAIAQLNSGKEFSELAEEVSEDPATKKNGGEFSGLIDRDNIDISPGTIDA